MTQSSSRSIEIFFYLLSMPSKKKHSGGPIKKKVSSPLANFLGMVAGFIILLITLLLVYGAIFGEPKSNSSPGAWETVDTELVPPAASGLSDLLTSTEFQKLLASAEVEDLVSFLIAMNAREPKPEPVPVRIERNRKRVKAAEQLMLLDVTRDQYELAAQSKLFALSSIYNTALESKFALEVNEEADQLLEFARSLVSDQSVELKLHGRLTILGLELVENSRRENALSLVQDSAELVLDVLRDFRGSPVAFEYFENILPRILANNESFGLQLAAALAAQAAEFDAEHAARFFRNMYDVTLLTPMTLRKRLDNLWPRDDTQKAKLIEDGLQLAADPQGGENVLNELALLMHWAEHEGDVESATRISQTLLDSASSRATPKLVELTSQAGKDGLRRCQALGQVLQFNGTTYSGSPFDPNQYDNHFVVILFLSFEKMDFRAFLTEHNAEFLSMAGRGVKLIAVSLDYNRDQSLEKFLERYPHLKFVTRGEEGTPEPIFYQYPAQMIPQAIIVNPRGTIVRTALNPFELTENLNKEILKWNPR
jgi:hypothetical protein